MRGNNDGGGLQHLAADVVLRFEDVVVYAVHDVKDLRHRPPPADVRVVVCGHSHRPSIAERAGVLYVNPGSAGPRRFRLPVSAGELVVDGASATAHWVELLHA